MDPLFWEDLADAEVPEVGEQVPAFEEQEDAACECFEGTRLS